MRSDCIHTDTHTQTGVQAITLTYTGLMRAQTQAHQHTHLPAEPLNLDIQDHIIIPRQDERMATKQSQEGSDAVWSNGCNDQPQTKSHDLESRFGSQPKGYMTLHLWPWRTFLAILRRCSPAAAAAPHSQECSTCALSLCASVSRSKADMSSGEETLEIGYCITGAIYLFWGLTYLIPPLNPVGVNSPRISNDLTKCNAEGVRASSLFWKWV